ncbi:conserved hypothetical protein [Coccidioides posadasii str. Silveira]|uniref:Uncharacterized protein n=1 Tax=Coccidioides posadasii (strain RMSCC 757 / Silveira) TaxID=443226 RepID=E9DB81_COCPS|nr:conserved hypothetical protein [Coccidioides posadasii str. Silveira]
MSGMSMLHSHNVSEASIYSTILIRSHGLETGQSQLLFGFTSVLVNLPSQSEASKHCSERITAMSAHQTLQDLDNKDESVISSESDKKISQYEQEESVMATHTLNKKKLLNYLTYIYRNHCNVGLVKTDDSIYLWFYLTNRPARDEDVLDIYKFKHQPIISLVAKMKIFDFN